MTQRHLLEQLAYEEIRRFLSQQFLLDPVLFMNTHGKRPEDLDGAYLRSYYKEALHQGITVQQSAPPLFRRKFQDGKMFHQSKHN
jgi:hypothetical protein